MAVADAIAAPVWQMLVNGERPLPATHRACITRVEVDSTWDGAAILRVQADCWDGVAGVTRFQDEPWLQFPQFVDVYSGYGAPDVPVGRFYMKRAEFGYGPHGTAGTFVGYDALERFMSHKQPRLFKGYERTSDVVREIVHDEYGMETEIHATEKITALRTIKKRDGSLVSLPPDHHKPAGDTDLRFLKLLAAGNDYLNPHIRFTGSGGHVGSGPEPWAEVFRFLPPDWERQKREADVFNLRYGPGGVVQTFTPSWSMAGLPTAIRVMGWDGRSFQVVEREILESGETRTVAGTREPGPGTSSNGTDPRAIVVSVLSSGQVKRIPKRKGRPEQEHWGREAVVTFRTTTDLSLEQYADAWLRSRATLGIAGPLALFNAQGSHRLLANQLHAVTGCGQRDSGWYIVHRANHVWTKAGGHAVSATVERQAGELHIAGS